MRRHHMLVAVSVCLLVLAGCTASPESSTPPGISEEGVTDVSALVEAHTEVLQSTSFTVQSSRTMQSEDPEFEATTNSTWSIDGTETLRGSVISNTSVTGEAPDQYLQAPDRTSTWRNGKTTVERTETNGNISDRRVDFLNTSVKQNQALHRKTIYELSTRSNATVERVSREGTEWYRVDAELNDTTITSNATMTLLVDPNGTVREVRTAKTVRYRSGPRRIIQRVQISDIGTTTVERPAWAAEILNESQ